MDLGLTAPPICEEPGCTKDLPPGRGIRGEDGKWRCERHSRRLGQLHPHEVGAESVAPAPERARPKGLVLLTEDEFEVLGILDDAHNAFMQLPQTDPSERTAFQTDYRHLTDRILRRAASRAYPDRFG